MSDDELTRLRKRLAELEELEDLRQRVAELEGRSEIPSSRPTNPVKGVRTRREVELEEENRALKNKLTAFEGLDPIDLFYSDPMKMFYHGIEDEGDLVAGILSGRIPLEVPPDPADPDWLKKRMNAAKTKARRNG